MDLFPPFPKRKKQVSSPSTLRRQIEKDAMRDMHPRRIRKVPRKGG